MAEPLPPSAAEIEEAQHAAQRDRFINRLRTSDELQQRIDTLIREIQELVKVYKPNPDLDRVIFERVYAVRTDADIAAAREGLPAHPGPHYQDAVWDDWLEAQS